MIKMDLTKLPDTFKGDQREYLEAQILSMKLYFAEKFSIPEYQKAIRVARSLQDSAQNLFTMYSKIHSNKLKLCLWKDFCKICARHLPFQTMNSILDSKCEILSIQSQQIPIFHYYINHYTNSNICWPLSPQISLWKFYNRGKAVCRRVSAT